MTTTLWTSSRGTARVELADRPVLRFESAEDWIARVRTHLRRIAMLELPVALALEHDAIEAPASPSSYPVLVARFGPARMRAERTMPTARACALVASLAELVRAYHDAGAEGVLGPFDPRLVVETDGRDAVLAPGLAAIVQSHDQGMRGMRGGATLAHARMTYDMLRGEPSIPHEVTSLAMLAIELVAGREPFPIGSQHAYLKAVVDGAHEPLETVAPRLSRPLRRTLTSALAIDAQERPTLEVLRDALLDEPGARAPTSDTGPTPRKPWWKVW